MEYFTRLVEQTTDKRDAYKNTLQRLPHPEFYVLYNGKKKAPARWRLRLSDAYPDIVDMVNSHDIRLECIVDVININKGNNTAIVEKSEELNGYVTLIYYIREFLAEGITLEDALEKAIAKCIDEGILEKYLRENSTEVFNMLMTEFNLADALEAKLEEGREEGREEREKEIINHILGALVDGVTYTSDQIKEILNRASKDK
jgi:hypothetical protein